MRAAKNMTLEVLKLGASYMVIFIHVLFSGTAGLVVDALARFAVPLFFLISGFFSYGISAEKIKKRIAHIVSFIVFASAFHICFNMTMILVKNSGKAVLEYLSGYLAPKALFKLVVLNEPISSGHLWYLFAMLYVYLIFLVLTKFHVGEKYIFTAALILMVAHVILGEGLSVGGIKVSIQLVRNFLLMGFPFFVMGLFLKKHENKLRSIANKWLFIMSVLGSIEAVLSCLLFGSNELYVGSVFVVFALTVVFVKYSDLRYPCFVEALAGCSVYIYILHIPISDFLSTFLAYCQINIYSSLLLENAYPVIVCIVSTAASYVLLQIIAQIRKKRNV